MADLSPPAVLCGQVPTGIPGRLAGNDIERGRRNRNCLAGETIARRWFCRQGPGCDSHDSGRVDCHCHDARPGNFRFNVFDGLGGAPCHQDLAPGSVREIADHAGRLLRSQYRRQPGIENHVQHRADCRIQFAGDDRDTGRQSQDHSAAGLHAVHELATDCDDFHPDTGDGLDHPLCQQAVSPHFNAYPEFDGRCHACVRGNRAGSTRHQGVSRRGIRTQPFP